MNNLSQELHRDQINKTSHRVRCLFWGSHAFLQWYERSAFVDEDSPTVAVYRKIFDWLHGPPWARLP